MKNRIKNLSLTLLVMASSAQAATIIADYATGFETADGFGVGDTTGFTSANGVTVSYAASSTAGYNSYRASTDGSFGTTAAGLTTDGSALILNAGETEYQVSFIVTSDAVTTVDSVNFIGFDLLGDESVLDYEIQVDGVSVQSASLGTITPVVAGTRGKHDFTDFDYAFAGVSGDVTIDLILTATSATAAAGFIDNVGLNITSSDVAPEPSSTALLGLGALAFAMRRRRA